MGLAAVELELPPPNGIEGLPKLLARLTERLGDRWKHEGVKGFRELHRARNAAQHDGLTPAGEHIPIWSAEVERFTKSLIAAVFAVELDEVFAAEAVVTPGWRELLLTAERQAAAGEIRGSLLSSKQTFILARDAFAGKRRTTRMPQPVSPLGAVPGIEELSKGLDLLQTFIDVAMFAPDPSEWVWLESVTPTHEVIEGALSRADAQRALTFVLGWVLRYEAFAARYLDFDDLYRPPEGPDPWVNYDPPRILRIDRDPALDRADTPAYVVDLADVPPDWDFWVLNAREAVDRKGTLIRSVGNERLIITAPDGTTPEDLWAAIHAVVTETHRLFCESQATKRAALEERVAAVEAYQAALKELGPGVDPPEVIAQGLWTNEISLHVLIAPPSDIRAFELERAVNDLLKDHDPPAGVRIDNAGVYVAPEVLPAHDLIAVLAQATAAIRARRQSEQATRQERETAREAMLDSVRALADLPSSPLADPET
jgi:hypothetical protein